MVKVSDKETILRGVNAYLNYMRGGSDKELVPFDKSFSELDQLERINFICALNYAYLRKNGGRENSEPIMSFRSIPSPVLSKLGLENFITFIEKKKIQDPVFYSGVWTTKISEITGENLNKLFMRVRTDFRYASRSLNKGTTQRNNAIQAEVIHVDLVQVDAPIEEQSVTDAIVDVPRVDEIDEKIERMRMAFLTEKIERTPSPLCSPQEHIVVNQLDLDPDEHTTMEIPFEQPVTEEVLVSNKRNAETQTDRVTLVDAETQTIKKPKYKQTVFGFSNKGLRRAIRLLDQYDQ